MYPADKLALPLQSGCEPKSICVELCPEVGHWSTDKNKIRFVFQIINTQISLIRLQSACFVNFAINYKRSINRQRRAKGLDVKYCFLTRTVAKFN